MKNYLHPYHLVDVSPWPILMSFAVLSFALLLVNWLTLGDINPFITFTIFFNISAIFILWLRDVIREAQSGFHTIKVRYGIMCGYLIFLITEVLLFVSFFWSLFHNSLNPSVELAVWPPLGINTIDYLGLPLLNSLLLLGGGFVATFGHHAFIRRNKVSALIGLLLGLFLTIIFVYVQSIEFNMSEFTISDSAYGSSFFTLCGAHGLHIFVAVLFLSCATFCVYTDSLPTEHALLLDTSLIYYHLVDLVWIFLYLILYYWGS